jgi:hypothetical protein
MTARIKGPALARLDEEGHRFYTWEGQRYWSVTTLIDAGLPKFIAAWYAKQVAELVHADLTAHGRRTARTLLREWSRLGLEELLAVKADGGLTSIKPEKLTADELALRYLKGQPARTRDAAAAKGLAVHAEAEDYVLANLHQMERLYIEGTVPQLDYDPAISPYMASFWRFLQDFRPHYLLTEASVFSHHGYAGTLDAGMELRLDGRLVTALVDYKSGKAVYPDAALQLSAYQRADFIGLPDGTSETLPTFDAAYVLHLTPTGYELLPVYTGDEVYRLFLHVCEIGRWPLPTQEHPRGLAAEVIGEPIVPRREP